MIERRWFLIGFALLLPLLGLGLLVLRPELDLVWEHQPSHFWLVVGAAIVSVTLAYVTNEAAARHADARIFLVSLAFLLSAGFLGLHALATPGVLLAEPNAGFVIATPVGLILASVLSAASVSPLAGPRATAGPAAPPATGSSSCSMPSLNSRTIRHEPLVARSTSFAPAMRLRPQTGGLDSESASTPGRSSREPSGRQAAAVSPPSATRPTWHPA